MINCYQFQDMNMLEHGQIVNRYFYDLVNLLENKHTNYEWCIPDKTIVLLRSIWNDSDKLSNKIIDDYQIYHDCGKYVSLYFDELGRKHFPNHTKNSAKVWVDNGGDHIVEYLILNDMYFHITKLNESKRILYWELLLLTAWAEIHANSTMFGGINSISFKIKKKHLIKVTKKLYEYD